MNGAVETTGAAAQYITAHSDEEGVMVITSEPADDGSWHMDTGINGEKL